MTWTTSQRLDTYWEPPSEELEAAIPPRRGPTWAPALAAVVAMALTPTAEVFTLHPALETLTGTTGAVWLSFPQLPATVEVAVSELPRHAAWLGQPASALSSVAFAVAGAQVMLRHRDGWGGTLGMSLVSLGLGSAFLHASLTLDGLLAATWAGAAVAIWLLCRVLQDPLNLRELEGLALWFGLSALFIGAVPVGAAAPAIGAVLVLAAAIWRRTQARRSRPHVASPAQLGLLGLTAAAWLADQQALGGMGTGWLQPHAVFHGLAACSLVGLADLVHRAD